jgi:hypothetical protein
MVLGDTQSRTGPYQHGCLRGGVPAEGALSYGHPFFGGPRHDCREGGRRSYDGERSYHKLLITRLPASDRVAKNASWAPRLFPSDSLSRGGTLQMFAIRLGQ